MPNINSLVKGRWVVRFTSSSYKYTKKIVYTIVKELRRTIKKSMTTGIAQKSCTALFPLWSLRKMIYQNVKNVYKEETESIERNFKYLNIEKKVYLS